VLPFHVAGVFIFLAATDKLQKNKELRRETSVDEIDG